jgi:ADP-heptose:LPS heptosyltransferase
MTTENIERILVMPAAGLGDLVMAAPVIRSLRRQFPQAYIAVLAHHSRGAAEVGAAMPYLDEVIDFSLQKYSWPAVIKFFLTSYWSMLSKLRGKHFDAVIILNPNPIRSIIVKMLRPNICLCPAAPGHPTEIGLELISQLGCSTEPLDFDFKIPQINLDHLLPAASPRPWIGIHPFSAMIWRYWRGFDELMEELKSLGGTAILLGKNARHRPLTNCIDVVNKLSITESLSLISRLDVLVSCDSGPMHLGFAAGTPTVALFGTVPPQFRMPLCNAEKHCVIYHGNDDGRYVQLKERKPETSNPLDDIDANEVYDCITKLLK